MKPRSAVLILAMPFLSLLLSGCLCGQITGGSGAGAGCGVLGPPPTISGVSPCGTEGSPAIVPAGSLVDYRWNASSCYDHFKFQMRNGTDWSTGNSQEIDGVRGNNYTAIASAVPGNYMWNVQGFDGPLDVPKTASYPPCYFRVT